MILGNVFAGTEYSSGVNSLFHELRLAWRLLLRSPGFAVTAVVCLALGMGAMQPSLNSLISRRTGAEEQGEVMGVAQSVASLSRVLGPLLAGALFAGLGLIVAGRLYSGFAIDVHPQARSYFAETLGDIETAVAAQPAGSIVYLENLQSPVTIFGPVIKNPAFPGRAAVFLIAHPSDTVDGRRVRFVERDRQIRTYYAQAGERRLGQLLVAPEDVPKRP